LLSRWLVPLVGSVARLPRCLGGSFPLLSRWLFPLVGSVASPRCRLGGSFPLLSRWLFPLVVSVALSPRRLGGSSPWLSRWLFPLVGSVALPPCWLGGSSPLLARWLFPLVVSVADSPCCLGGSFPLSARWLFPLVGSVALPPCRKKNGNGSFASLRGPDEKHSRKLSWTEELSLLRRPRSTGFLRSQAELRTNVDVASSTALAIYPQTFEHTSQMDPITQTYRKFEIQDATHSLFAARPACISGLKIGKDTEDPRVGEESLPGRRQNISSKR
jgi:hypothetical protein